MQKKRNDLKAREHSERIREATSNGGLAMAAQGARAEKAIRCRRGEAGLGRRGYECKGEWRSYSLRLG